MKNLFLKKCFIFTVAILSFSHSYGKDQSFKTKEDNDKNWQKVGRRYLSFIVSQNKARVGLEFKSKTPQERLDLYDQLQHVQEYVIAMGPGPFKSFAAFEAKMEELNAYIPDGRVLNSGTNEVLARTAFRLSKLQWDMGSGVDNYSKSLGQVQLADYNLGIEKYYQLANSACSGSLFFEWSFFQKISQHFSNLGSWILSGKDCQRMIKEDLMPIISPHKEPTQITNSNSTSGTSIYLASKIVPDANFPSNPIFNAFEQIQKVDELDARLNLFDALKKHFSHLSNRELILFINAADTNFGFSFFMLNAIIDLSSTEDEMLEHVNNFNQGLGQLYWLIQRHSEKRKTLFPKGAAKLPRQYHYWAGAYVACELVEKGHNPALSALVSGTMGLAYEAQTSGPKNLAKIRKNLSGDFGEIVKIILGKSDYSAKDLIEGKVPLKVFSTRYSTVDDTLLHVLGAVHGIKLCK